MRLLEMSRRSLLALGLGASLLAVPAGRAFAEEKVITWGKPGEITGFDVHVIGTVASWELFQLVYETLLTADENFDLQPGLAESWEQTSPTSYTFHLRKDAKWSNGRPVVADDVIGSLRRIINPETASYWAKQFGTIARMEAPDNHTVVVELEEPHTAFLPALAHISAAIIPIQEYEAGSFDPTSQLLGSGPFMVAEHKQDESWTLVRNPYYWRKGYPLADKLFAPIIPDESARIAALRDGRVDYTSFTNPDVPLLLARDRNVEVVPQQTTNYYRVDVNALSEKSPFHDRRVRQAMNLSLDREAIAQIAFGGTVSVDYPVPAAFQKQACRELPTYALPRAERLERARALLKEAGNTAPKIGIIATPANPMNPRIAQVVQQSMQEAGFQVEILQQPMAEYLQKVFTDGDFDMALSWLAGYTDPTMVISWWNPKFAVWNGVFQEDVPALDQALEEVKKMPVGAARDEKLAEVCKLIDEGANLLALVSKVDYIAYRDDQVAMKLATRTGSSNAFQYAAEYKPLD